MNKDFLHFLLDLWNSWWFFKVQQHLQCTPLWKIIKYDKSLAKNEEKPCSTCIKPISLGQCGYLKPGFQVPITQVSGIHYPKLGFRVPVPPLLHIAHHLAPLIISIITSMLLLFLIYFLWIFFSFLFCRPPGWFLWAFHCWPRRL